MQSKSTDHGSPSFHEVKEIIYFLAEKISKYSKCSVVTDSHRQASVCDGVTQSSVCFINHRGGHGGYNQKA